MTNAPAQPDLQKLLDERLKAVREQLQIAHERIVEIRPQAERTYLERVRERVRGTITLLVVGMYVFVVLVMAVLALKNAWTSGNLVEFATLKDWVLPILTLMLGYYFGSATR